MLNLDKLKEMLMSQDSSDIQFAIDIIYENELYLHKDTVELLISVYTILDQQSDNKERHDPQFESWLAFTEALEGISTVYIHRYWDETAQEHRGDRRGTIADLRALLLKPETWR